jgi:ATP-dependent Zn protease
MAIGGNQLLIFDDEVDTTVLIAELIASDKFDVLDPTLLRTF